MPLSGLRDDLPQGHGPTPARADPFDAKLLVSDDRIVVLGPGGGVVQAVLRKRDARWCDRPRLEELLTTAGFVDVRWVGSQECFVAIAHRAS